MLFNFKILLTITINVLPRTLILSFPKIKIIISKLLKILKIL